MIGVSHAQGGGPAPACTGQLDSKLAAQLQRCEAAAGCRQLAHLIDDACPVLKTFLGALAARGGGVDERSLRLALVESGVPPMGLASCLGAFNRSLCRQMLRAEDPAGATAPVPAPTAEQRLQAEARRLVEQHERARLPADAHHFAGIKLALCAQARTRAEREVQCREAIEAVQACEHFRDDWTRRRDAVVAEAGRLGLEAVHRSVVALELATCPTHLPDSPLTPAQVLARSAENDRAGATSAAPVATPAALPPAAPPVAPPPAAPPAAAAAPSAARPAAGAVPAAAVAATGAGGIGPAAARSVCQRNAAKAEDSLRRAGLRFAGAANDLVTMQLQLETARLLEPCIGWDEATRNEHASQRARADAVRRHCAGEHRVDECTPYGERAAENRRYLELWRAEVGKALADAEYSVDLGPARTAPPVLDPAAGLRYGSECKPALLQMESEFEAIDRRRPANAELVATLQTSLYMLGEQLALLEKLCRDQREYGFRDSIRERLQRTQQACRSAAGSAAECVPRVAW